MPREEYGVLWKKYLQPDVKLIRANAQLPQLFMKWVSGTKLVKELRLYLMNLLNESSGYYKYRINMKVAILGWETHKMSNRIYAQGNEIDILSEPFGDLKNTTWLCEVRGLQI